MVIYTGILGLGDMVIYICRYIRHVGKKKKKLYEIQLSNWLKGSGSNYFDFELNYISSISNKVGNNIKIDQTSRGQHLCKIYNVPIASYYAITYK
jgi:hypothetical protein